MNLTSIPPHRPATVCTGPDFKNLNSDSGRALMAGPRCDRSEIEISGPHPVGRLPLGGGRGKGRPRELWTSVDRNRIDDRHGRPSRANVQRGSI
jgi:hypothetical protein